MGSDQAIASSRSEYGAVLLQLENPICISGEQLRGAFIVNIYRAYPVEEVSVTIKGEEIITKKGRMSRTPVIIQTMPMNIPHYNSVIQPGQYILPFIFNIPLTCPSAIDTICVRNARGRIEYSVTGKIQGHDKGIPEMAYMLPFIVNQPILFENDCLTSDKQKVTGYFWRKKGTTSLEVVMAKNGLYAGEQMFLKVNIDNSQCDCDIAEVKAHLYEEITLTFNRNFGFMSPFKSKREVTVASFSGVPRGGKTSYVKTLKLAPKEPAIRLESVNGSSVKRTYVLEIVPMYDMNLVSNKPKVAYYLNIGSLASKPQVQPQQHLVAPVQPLMLQAQPYVPPVQPYVQSMHTQPLLEPSVQPQQPMMPPMHPMMPLVQPIYPVIQNMSLSK